MRVITGSAKGRKLFSVPGKGTRPITARVKSALFSILTPRLRGTTVLDLFAGSGAVGIEALSRGADHVVFVERARKALNVVRRNLETTRLLDRAELIQTDAFHYLTHAPQEGQFDLIYVAPPQHKELWLKALLELDGRRLLADHGLVIVQIFPKEAADVTLLNLEQVDERHYGSTLLLFYAWRQSSKSGRDGQETKGERT